MNEKYEAAELFVVGRARDVILGMKVLVDYDNTAEPPPDLRVESLALFEE